MIWHLIHCIKGVSPNFITIDKPINIQNGVVLEEDTVWKCVFNLVYVHDNSKGKDRGLKNQGYMIT